MDIIKTATGSNINIQDSNGDRLLDTKILGNTYQADVILPNEYTQVDYIQSSGTQYIDTGFKPNQNTRMTAKVYINGLVSTYDNIGGARNGNTNQFHIIIASNKFDARYETQNSNISYTTTGLFNFDFNKNKFYINNSLAKTFTDTTFTSEYNAYVFAVNNAGTVSQKADYKLYSMKWYDNDTLVRDFIPCYRNSDNEVGLYDLVNNVFYVNQGTGSFTYGSVVSIPNPDYPQSIEVVTGENNVVIEGKNLFNPTYEVETQYKNNGTVQTTNWYNLINEIISVNRSNYTYGACYFNKLTLEVGTYTWSLDVSQSENTTNKARVRIRDLVNLTSSISIIRPID